MSSDDFNRIMWKLSLIYALNGRQCNQEYEETQLGQHTRFGYLSRITQHSKSHKSLLSNQAQSLVACKQHI